MTKRELIKALESIGDDEVVVCAYEQDGGWDNIRKVERVDGTPTIVFGGGSPFSGE